MTKDELQKAVEAAVIDVLNERNKEAWANIEKAMLDTLKKAADEQGELKEPASPQEEPEAVEEVAKVEETPVEPTTEQTELAKALERIAELEKQAAARPVAFSSGAEVAKAQTKPGKSYGHNFG